MEHVPMHQELGLVSTEQRRVDKCSGNSILHKQPADQHDGPDSKSCAFSSKRSANTLSRLY